jgi:hypothetical protein
MYGANNTIASQALLFQGGAAVLSTSTRDGPVGAPTPRNSHAKAHQQQQQQPPMVPVQSSVPGEYLIPTLVQLAPEAYGHMHGVSIVSSQTLSVIFVDTVLPVGPQPETTNATKFNSAR